MQINSIFSDNVRILYLFLTINDKSPEQSNDIIWIIIR
jgi:hypothetical protein